MTKKPTPFWQSSGFLVLVLIVGTILVLIYAPKPEKTKRTPRIQSATDVINGICLQTVKLSPPVPAQTTPIIDAGRRDGDIIFCPALIKDRGTTQTVIITVARTCDIYQTGCLNIISIDPYRG